MIKTYKFRLYPTKEQAEKQGRAIKASQAREKKKKGKTND